MTTDLGKLDDLLKDQPYVSGYTLSEHDFEKKKSVKTSDLKGRPHLTRWFHHISSFPETPSKSTEKMTVGNEENLPQRILELLDSSKEGFNSITLAAEWKIDHQKLIGGIKSLLSNERLLTTKDVSENRLALTAEGNQIASEGSHEFRVFELVGSDGCAQADVAKQSFGKLGLSKAMAAGWVSLDKSGAGVRVIRKVQEVEDVVRKQLDALKVGESPVGDKEKQELKKRKLISETVVKGLHVSKGPAFTTNLAKQEADLTPEMIANGSWKDKTFKKYNFDSLGVAPASGHLHPLMKVRSEFRQIFFSMGFSEMQTNKYVESSFWNFDALFQPQQHPARDAHDTFFVSDPSVSTKFPADYLEKVKTVHSKGGFGSIGYNYDWKLEEAQKNVLRTHTTAVSARQLYQLAQEGFKPSKLFSIDRVFRNETLDATHLAEFHQVEGVIAERNLSLSHLIGIFTEFFKKLGITNLRFKPTYNPYTEPSMEIFAYHDGLAKWVEIGNSGMFRPEMLLPMGLPEDVNVAGYGLSLERPTMIRYGINNIRDMFGPKVDLQMIYNGPICVVQMQFEEYTRDEFYDQIVVYEAPGVPARNDFVTLEAQSSVPRSTHEEIPFKEWIEMIKPCYSECKYLKALEKSYEEELEGASMETVRLLLLIEGMCDDVYTDIGKKALAKLLSNGVNGLQDEAERRAIEDLQGTDWSDADEEAEKENFETDHFDMNRTIYQN
ncbi:unnamed protein product [Caenorhabditis auriculariae]|uniref:phenylalanine--tRNA ligase n=1 Tax=Caenorhabditis auriculariae TaxID=2777116 RepID=A0A8S1GQG7_9PELO|nr:unnamed protein product [Caenorhabditis auriculariae]